MKPTFALDLSRDQIALLHRTPKGWLTIGEVAFEAADLAEALDYLRKTALGLSPLGLTTKVILPNSQILYTEIHAPGPSREDKRRQIAAALQDLTPYAVEDVVFDWSGKGSVVRVAVTARETLDEAEAFAVTHRLNPVSFVAIPEDGTFVGEAWFGPSNSTDAVLAPGETVDRDREAVSIIPLPPPALASAAETASDGNQLEEDDLDSLPGLEEALSAAEIETDLAVAAARLDDLPNNGALGSDDTAFNEPAGEAVPTLPKPDSEAAPAPAGETTLNAAKPEPGLRPDGEVTGTAAAPSSAAAELAPAPSRPEPAETDSVQADPVQADPVEPEEAPFADVSDEAELGELPSVASANGTARVVASGILDDDLPPAPSPAALIAFSSRRSATTEPTAGSGRAAPPVTSVQGQAAAPRHGPALGAAGSAASSKPFPGSVTDPTIPGSRSRALLKPSTGPIPRPIPPGATTVKSPVRPNGTFGALPAKRGRTGFTFMVLIGLLLLSLALVAAWASFFLTQAANEAGSDTPAEIVEVPLVEDEMAADLQDPQDFAEPAETEAALVDAAPAVAAPADAAAADLEALSVEEAPVNIGGDDSGTPPEDSVAASLAETAAPGDPAAGTEAETAGTAESSGEPPPGSTIATDVSGSRTPAEDQDEIFLAAMDAPPPVLDALALPAPSAIADAPPAAPMPPPAFGTVYKFDALGLLVPTQEGILTPEGIMLFAGQPPLVPPTRSPLAAAAATAASVEAATAAPGPVAEAAANSTSAADASLVTAGEATTAASEALVAPAPSDPAMAEFRPKARPEGLAGPDDGASLDADAATDVVTLRPLARPASVSAAATAANPEQPGTAVADLGAQGASLAAQAEAQRAAAEALEASNPSIVAISMRPAARPSDLSRAVEAAVAAAVREPDPSAEAEVELAAANTGDEAGEEIDEPETEGAAPSIPTKASVAKQATYANAINLSKVNLIGTFGTSSKPYALVRLANGRYKKVRIGDKIDGGVVKAITENEVRYQKGGKLVSLKMPKA